MKNEDGLAFTVSSFRRSSLPGPNKYSVYAYMTEVSYRSQGRQRHLLTEIRTLKCISVFWYHNFKKIGEIQKSFFFFLFASVYACMCMIYFYLMCMCLYE